jgi:hypothetical protein
MSARASGTSLAPRPEIESQGVDARLDRSARIIEPGDAADLHQGPHSASTSVFDARWAMRDLAVSGSNIANLTLPMRESMAVSGRLVIEGLSRLPDILAVRVGLRPTPASAVQIPCVHPDQGRPERVGRASS